MQQLQPAATTGPTNGGARTFASPLARRIAKEAGVDVAAVTGSGPHGRVIKADVEAKGITFFQQIDQSRLAAEAGIQIRPSTLLVFGNPALGTQFMARNPEAGIDWPVRVLVYQDVGGTVWAAYTDFGWIARRHAIADDAPFKKAAEVIASVTGSVAK